MSKDWGERLQEKSRPIPTSAFAKDSKPIIVSSFPNKTCSHIYRYLKTANQVDIFYCEKCLEYKRIDNYGGIL